MRPEWVELFPLRPDVVMLNHASYGLATTRLLGRAEEIRRQLESDPLVTLGEALQDRLTLTAAGLANQLGLDPAGTALTTSATAGAAALQRSLPLTAGEVVLALDCEYSSVLRGWQRRCDEVGARLVVVPVPLPLLDVEELLERMSNAAGADRVRILQFSAVTSSAALLLPVERLAAWGQARGATVIVDAAHGPGHCETVSWSGVDAVLGTLHKWIPVPRSVGFLWAATKLVDLVAPAETSLTFDAEQLNRRFSWPGTFDPAARLCLPEALSIWSGWAEAGELERCEKLADTADDVLTSVGAIATTGPAFRPPRLRAFILPGVALPALQEQLSDKNIRAWTGTHGTDSSLVRVATHIYNDLTDLEMLADVVSASFSMIR